ncbi:MAG TPA: hypothetical protein VKU60_12445, partial [Chloroflexota bacterium]|nr:hypothetical protein [Chloroflexota bacterium]
MLLITAGVGHAMGLRPAPGTTLWEWTSPFATGANIYAITHYGHSDASPWSSSMDADSDLSALRQMRASVVRVIPAYRGITDEEAARRLGVFLDRAATYNIAVIVSLTNFYGDSQLYPKSTERFYTEQWRGIPYLNDDFFAGGYRAGYLDFVRTVVTANAHRPNIYAWEPGNELQNGDPAAFLNFMRETTDLIRRLDGSHPVADGMTEALQSGFTPVGLYSQLPSVDF